jgi:phage portal protein BeeE
MSLPRTTALSSSPTTLAEGIPPSTLHIVGAVDRVDVEDAMEAVATATVVEDVTNVASTVVVAETVATIAISLARYVAKLGMPELLAPLLRR